ncbi:uncharacterized protein LOC114526630 [Dendronephthya gigantea]|uniref:uncharacterized protein LOC114526630 n=1 Tax=Dendronephthya gigantea TaxID=151771 RepID=UPI0010698552|nr:uncharacterized protein LOC114526630 [Dendronephthya gigantea]
MFGVNAGKQCVAMSLYAIVYNEIKSVNIWDKSILNSILVSGNSLYCVISQSINKSYLLLTDVPEFVDIDNHTFNLQYSDSFSGSLYLSENNLPYVTLEHALNEVFHSLNYKSCLLTIGMNTVAIMMPFPDVFKVFDSHSRDMYGRPSALHYCVLISVEGIENLAEYFRLTSRCNEANIVLPFELKGLRCIDNNDLETATQLLEQHSVNRKELNNQIIGNTFRKRVRPDESPEKKEARLAKNRNADKVRRQNESAEQNEARLAKNRNADKVRRQNESVEQNEARLAKNRNADKVRRQNESAEQREARLAKNRNAAKVRRQNESAEQKEARLAKNRNAKNATKQNETIEQRIARIAKEKERKRASRKNTPSAKQKKSNESHSVESVRNIANAENSYLSNEDIDTLTLITGNVVNVPADVNSTVNVLPRLSDETDDLTTSNLPEDEWSEDEAEIPAGVTDSMLTPPDFVSDSERQEIYNVAPGEGKIKDWFYIVEYQQRGSPHIHMLIWLENTPVFGVDKDEDVVAILIA